MDDATSDALAVLKQRLESLCDMMESTANSGVSEFARWNGYKAYAHEFNIISTSYNSATGLESTTFNMDKMPNSGKVTWPSHKKIYEGILVQAKSLLANINQIRPAIPSLGFEDILHPIIAASSLHHYRNGDFRNSVLDAALAISDKIRERTGLDLDGDDLCNNAFSPNNPMLVFSETSSQSGMNDQKGFLDIFKGFYRGVRNPKAHSMLHDLDAGKAAQYLVFTSLLMRRVTEATVRRTATPPAAAP
ncbi:TIGR02391 family protein [Sphingopyxis fribergensis]